jgi:predicted transposase YbfD/YdcC
LIKARTETTYKAAAQNTGATTAQPPLDAPTTTAQAKAANEAKKASPKTKVKAKAPKKDEVIVRHFVSSLGEAEAGRERLATIIRSHWSCESRHWERDVQWREDECLIRNPNAACALALIRTGLQALLRRTVKEPLPVIFENVADHLELGLTWLKQRNFRL